MGTSAAWGIDPGSCTPGETQSSGGGVRARRARTRDGRGVVLAGPEPGIGDAGDVDAQADLLERLAAEGVEALPRVLGRAPGAYVREDAAAWRPGGGRRSAVAGDPRTAERLAQAAVRERLEAALDRLHAADHVLGLTGREGLGFRPDGTVMIRDLSALAPGATLAGRLADQRWLDSVLGDAGRTLRRRADAAPAPWIDDADGTGPGPAAGGAERSDPPAVSPLQAPPPPSAPRAASDDAPTRRVAAEERRPARMWSPLAARAGDAGLVVQPWSQESGRPWSARLPAGRDAGRGEGAAASMLRRWRRSLQGRAPFAWRGLAVGAAAVCALTVLIVLATVPGTSPQAEAEGASTASAAPGAEDAAAEESAVEPADPVGLVGVLASARREHLVAGVEDTATAPGSPAADQDARLAEAYRHVTVTGWTTTVVSAEVIACDTTAGTASIRARISESERTLTLPDGTVRTVPAVPEHEVVLHLVWLDGRWLLERVDPV